MTHTQRCVPSRAFITSTVTTSTDSSSSSSNPYCSTTSSSSPSSSLSMAGFGAAPSGSNSKKDSKKTKAAKLKPKQQWDRYGELKNSEKVRVAVRVIGSAQPASPSTMEANDVDVDGDVDVDAKLKWLEVGSVKSKNDAYTEAAIIRHRLLIAEHARRVFPLQVSAKDKDKLEWAYFNGEDEEWVMLVVLASSNNMPDDIEKMSGFEGLPDPSGFYTRSTETLADNSVKGYDNMKKKGIIGFIGMEVHD
jgi:hypothetical protein